MNLHTVESESVQSAALAEQFHFDFLPHSPIVVQRQRGQLTSDAGLLVARQFDQRWNYSARLAACLVDRRVDPDHSHLSMLRQRLYGVLADYEDCNDHDTLRHEPVFKLIADRAINGDPLAAQPTLSRFENSVTVSELNKMIDFLADTGIEHLKRKHHGAMPERITLDFDPTDDPTHGNQQLSLFHGYYEQYQYFPMIVSEPTTKHLLLARLRHGTAHAALGADDDLRELAAKLREQRSDMAIHVRGDPRGAGFGVPWFIDACESLENTTYTLGFACNARIDVLAAPLLTRAIEEYKSTGHKARLFAHFSYQAESWKAPRTIVVKAECHAGGTNVRCVVTNLPVHDDAQAQQVYDHYIQRGESEHRMNELKNALHAAPGTRLSCHRLKANFFRLLLHTAAYNLLNALRNHEDVPVELRVAQPQTWRSRIIKVAAILTQTTRRVVVSLTAWWPHWSLLRTTAARASLSTA